MPLPTAEDFLKRLARTHSGVHGLLPAWRNLSDSDRRATTSALLTQAVLQMDTQTLTRWWRLNIDLPEPLPSDLVVQYLDARDRRRAQQSPLHRADYDEAEAEHYTAEHVSKFMGSNDDAWTPDLYRRVVVDGVYGLLKVIHSREAFRQWWKSLECGDRQALLQQALDNISTHEFEVAPYAVQQSAFTFIRNNLMGPLSTRERQAAIQAYMDIRLDRLGDQADGLEEVRALNVLANLRLCDDLRPDYPARHSWLEPLADEVKSALMANALVGYHGALAFPASATHTSPRWAGALGQRMKEVAVNPGALHDLLIFVMVLEHASHHQIIRPAQLQEVVRSFVGEDSSVAEKQFAALDDHRDNGLMNPKQKSLMVWFKVLCKELLLQRSMGAGAPPSSRPRL